MAPPVWPSTIRYVQPTDPVASGIVNNPLATLAERTNYLKVITEAITTNEFTYLSNVAVNQYTVAGQIVYWNTSTNEFAPALAAWDDILLNPDGTLRPSEKAVIAGILAYKHTTKTGSIILGGFVRGFENLAGLFGTSSPAKGIYYLSADTAGQATQATPPLAILALQYCGDGNILIPTVRFEHSTHDHKKYELKDTMWLAANPVNFPNYDIPAGATYGYNYEAAGEEEIKAVFALYPGIGAFIYKSSADNIPDTTIYVNENNIWWTDVSAPLDNVYMYLTNPNSHGPNIVRAIKTDTPESLDITLVNGLATINKKAWTVSTGNAGFQVVKEIGGNTIKYGQVVEKITTGDGIVVSNHSGDEGQGIVEISLAEFSERYIDADVVNLNNALEVTVEGAIYTALPAQRESSMLCTAPGQVWTGGTTKKVAVWIWARGPMGGGYSIPDITCEVTIYPPATSSGVLLPTTTYTHTLSRAGSTVSNGYYLIETVSTDRVDIPSGALVQYKLSLDNTTIYDQLILRQGIKIYAS